MVCCAGSCKNSNPQKSKIQGACVCVVVVPSGRGLVVKTRSFLRRKQANQKGAEGSRGPNIDAANDSEREEEYWL